MRYTEYVVTGWVLTAAVLTLYWVRLVVRTRRARRIVDSASPPTPR